MKNLFTLAALSVMLFGCTTNKFECKWKVEVTAEQPTNSIYISAKYTADGDYEYTTANQTTLSHEFKASKKNNVSVGGSTYSGGLITVKIYRKKEMVKEETFQGSTNGMAKSFNLKYEN